MFSSILLHCKATYLTTSKFNIIVGKHLVILFYYRSMAFQHPKSTRTRYIFTFERSIEKIKQIAKISTPGYQMVRTIKKSKKSYSSTVLCVKRYRAPPTLGLVGQLFSMRSTGYPRRANKAFHLGDYVSSSPSSTRRAASNRRLSRRTRFASDSGEVVIA
jgi:hypothetical protein